MEMTLLLFVCLGGYGPVAPTPASGGAQSESSSWHVLQGATFLFYFFIYFGLKGLRFSLGDVVDLGEAAE